MTKENSVELKSRAELILSKLKTYEQLLEQAKKGKKDFGFWISLFAGIIMIIGGIWNKGLEGNADTILILGGFSWLTGLNHLRTKSRLDALVELIKQENPLSKT
jgi:hypothetical protein